MVPRSTLAAYRFATGAIPAAVDALGVHSAHRAMPVPFYGLQSPARTALKTVLAMMHDVAHGRPTDQPPSVGGGVCVVGNKGTGTSTLLATAAAAVPILFPEFEHVVHVKPPTSVNQLDRLLDDRVYSHLRGPTAVFVDDAHLLDSDAWNCLRHLLRVSGQHNKAKGTFIHDHRICVVAAGNDSTMAALREHECGNVHEYFARVTVQPLQTVAEYRAFHQHVRADRAQAACVPCPDPQVEAAIQSWHLHTGGNFGLLHGYLSTADIAEAVELARRGTSLPLGKSTHVNNSLATVCLVFLRRKLFLARWRGGFCPFEAATITATGDELQEAAEQWRRRHGGGTATYPDLDDLCIRGFLRVVSHSNLPGVTQYGFGTPVLAMTPQEWSTHAHPPAKGRVRVRA